LTENIEVWGARGEAEEERQMAMHGKAKKRPT
jgi:hypothetical protein